MTNSSISRTSLPTAQSGIFCGSEIACGTASGPRPSAFVPHDRADLGGDFLAHMLDRKKELGQGDVPQFQELPGSLPQAKQVPAGTTSAGTTSTGTTSAGTASAGPTSAETTPPTTPTPSFATEYIPETTLGQGFVPQTKQYPAGTTSAGTTSAEKTPLTLSLATEYNRETALGQGFVPQTEQVPVGPTPAGPTSAGTTRMTPPRPTSVGTPTPIEAAHDANRGTALVQGFVPQGNSQSLDSSPDPAQGNAAPTPASTPPAPPSSKGTPPTASIPHSSVEEASASKIQQGSGGAHDNDDQQGNSQVSDSSSDLAQGNAASNTSPSLAQSDLPSQDLAQPGRARFTSLPAISSAMGQQLPGPPILALGSQTLTRGGVVTVDNTPIALPTQGYAVVANGESIAVGPSPTAITIGSKIIPVTPLNEVPQSDSSPQALTLDGQRLLPASVITIDNTPISLPTGGSALVVDGKTIPIGSTPTAITIGSQKIPINPENPGPTAFDSTPHALTLNGEGLNPGSAVTIDNTPVSLPSTGSALIVNGKTVPIGLTPTGITIGSQIVSITPNTLAPVPTTLVLNGQTLQPGGKALTISSGIEGSLPASGTDVVLISGASTTTEALGPAILSGLGIAPTGTSGNQASPSGVGAGNNDNGGPMAFTGGGGRVVEKGYQGLWVWEAMAMLGFMVGLWWL